VKRGNHQHVQLEIAEPNITDEKLELYRRYHEFQAEHKGWPEHRGNSEDDYRESFVENPIPTEEWTYRINGKLVGVGYVDVVPTGLSAIYFYYDPDFRSRSLGTWNVLSIIEEARRRGLEYVYLGFFVRGCSSLSYKANFHPHERLNPQSGIWQPIQEEQDADDGAIE
jgi:arginine-tRNA-protein transferase